VQLEKGTRLGDYEIADRIGAGGMGEVYRARDRVLGRTVAVKVLAARQNDRSVLARFEQEARLASSLNHPNIITVHAVGRSGSLSYIVMEFVNGLTVAETLKAGPIPMDRVFSIAIQVADGLAKAHEAAIAHRDLKPQNIMVTPDGLAKILDFGLSKLTQPTAAGVTIMASYATEGSPIIGTPAYMSPEQARGLPVDFRSDQFSFGIILYEMISGIQPFIQESAAQTMASVIEREPRVLSEANPNVPADLERIVRRCLAKTPSERYASTRELLNDLRQAYERFKIAPLDLSTRVQRGLRRSQRLAFATLVLLLIAVLAIVLRQNFRPANITEVPQAPAMKRVAIVPFTTVNGDAASQTFADGLVDTVTAKLMGLEQFQSELQVIPASEVRREAVQTAQAARTAFGVTAAVTGNVQRGPDTVSVVLNVIDPVRMQQIRSSSIQIPTSELPALQERVATQIAEGLELSLQREGLQFLKTSGTSTPDAISEFIAGRGDLQRSEQPQRVESAISHFRRSIDTDRAYALAHAGLCEAYWRKFRLTKEPMLVSNARESCRTALELDPKSPAVHVTAATIYNGTGQFEEALKSAQAALSIDSRSASAFRELATAYQNLNRMPEAEATFQRAIQTRPNDYTLYSAFGAFYYRIGKYAEAAAQFRQVTRLTPDNYRAYSNLGGVYFYLKRNEEAIENLQRSLDLHPTGSAYTNLGAIYYGMEKYAEAAKALERAVALNDREVSYWRSLAEAYNWIPGAADKARAAYLRTIELGEEQLRLNPRDPQVLRNVSEGYARTGNKKKAIELLQRALSVAPDDVATNESAAYIYELLGDRGKAIELFAKALRNGLPMERIDKNPGLAALRADPRFQALRER
jgi:serine/threonine-protein kinase